MNAPVQVRGGRPASIAKAAQKALREIQIQALDELARRAASGNTNALRLLREIADEKNTAGS
jgi:hypothetical protein